MTEEVLSKDEIDTLLNGVDEGEIPVETALDHQKAKPYDLTSQDHIVSDKLPTLEMINERFSQNMQQSLFDLLRQQVTVESTGIENVKYSEYQQTMSMPTSVNLVRIRPLRGTALVVLNADLVVNLVNRFFGGGDRKIEIGEREFTATELRLVNKLLTQFFVDMKEAWKSVMSVEFELTGHEANPAMATCISPGEVVIVSSFDVSLSDGEGKLQIAIPYSMLEPVRETLDAGAQSETEEKDERWARSLERDLMFAKVPINSKVVEHTLTLRDILNFKPGDVIPVSLPDKNLITVNDVPVFEARLGKSRNQLAFKITDVIERLPTEQ